MKCPFYFRYLILRKSRKCDLRIGRAAPVYRYMLPMSYIGSTKCCVHVGVEVCFRCTVAVKQFQSFGSSNRIFPWHSFGWQYRRNVEWFKYNTSCACFQPQKQLVGDKKADAWNQDDSHYILQTLIRAQMTCLSVKLLLSLDGWNPVLAGR